MAMKRTCFESKAGRGGGWVGGVPNSGIWEEGGGGGVSTSGTQEGGEKVTNSGSREGAGRGHLSCHADCNGARACPCALQLSPP